MSFSALFESKVERILWLFQGDEELDIDIEPGGSGGGSAGGGGGG